MKFIRSRLAAVVVALVVLVPAAAQADEALQQAKKHFAAGKTHYKLGRFEKALASFSAAYEAKEMPAFLFNIGQCHMQMKNYERAIFFYEHYLSEAANARNRDVVEKLLADAKKLYTRQQQLMAEKQRADALEKQRKERERLAALEKQENERRTAEAERKRKEAEAKKKEDEAKVALNKDPADPADPVTIGPPDPGDPVTRNPATVGISPGGALLRSSAVPGWGQLASGRKGLGYAFIGATVAGIGAAAYMHTQADTAEGYIDDAGPLQRAAMYQQAREYSNYRNIAVGVTAAVWVGAAVDAYFGARRGTRAPTRRPTVHVGPTPDGEGAGVVIQGRF